MSKQFGLIIKTALFISKYTIMEIVNVRLITVVITLFFCYSTIMWSKSESKVMELTKQIESIKSEKDSIQTSSSSCEINLLRYQITLEELEKSNPKTARKFKKIMNQYSE